jgi:uncharacterized protein (TIGR03437 family)
VAVIWGAAAQTPNFTITTVAGNGRLGYSGDGGQATSAALSDPRGVITDPAGNVYFCDRGNNAVRKIDLSGIITTVAGTGAAGYNGDNIQGTQARLNSPWRVTIDPAGNLYIADSGNNRIRKLAPNGIITTVAGTGKTGYTGDGGAATSATMNFPEQAELDAFGNLYIADSGNNVVRKIGSNGIITTVAGNGFGAVEDNNNDELGGYSGDGGPATKAELNGPVSLAVDPSGNLWISDQGNNVVRYVDAATGLISTVAGIHNRYSYTGDGGPASKATFATLAGIARDAAGNIYVTDDGNDVLRVILPDGTIQTVAGDGDPGFSGDGGPATGAELNSLRQVAVGTFGDIYISDTFNYRIRKLTPSATTLGTITNAFGNIPMLAPNAWLIIKGSNLASTTRVWQASDFVNNQMPTALDGVSVTINGVSAYIYYISPQQINALAPPGLTQGIAQITVSNKGISSAPAPVIVQPQSPTFFTFSGGSGNYVTAVHSDGSLVGPKTLYPGSSTPAHAGETVLLFANGFGPTSNAVVSGSNNQSGALPSLPAVTVNGAAATVQFAGLISPGLYQFNVLLPGSLPSGDNALIASYNGQTTQAGVLITIQ